MICPYCEKNNATVVMINYTHSMACAECDAEQEPHSCDYHTEINKNPDFECTCSKAAEYECGRDI